MLHSSPQQPPKSPLLSVFYSPGSLSGVTERNTHSSSPPPWERVSPLLSALEQWTHVCPPSLPAISSSKEPVSVEGNRVNKMSTEIRMAKSSGVRERSQVRVSLSLPFLVNALKITEQQILTGATAPSCPPSPSSSPPPSLSLSPIANEGVNVQSMSEENPDVPLSSHPLSQNEIEEQEEEEEEGKEEIRCFPSPEECSESSLKSASTDKLAHSRDKVAVDGQGSQGVHQSSSHWIALDEPTIGGHSPGTSSSSSSLTIVSVSCPHLQESATIDSDSTLTFGSSSPPLPDEADDDGGAPICTNQPTRNLITNQPVEQEEEEEKEKEEEGEEEVEEEGEEEEEEEREEKEESSWPSVSVTTLTGSLQPSSYSLERDKNCIEEEKEHAVSYKAQPEPATMSPDRAPMESDNKLEVEEMEERMKEEEEEEMEVEKTGTVNGSHTFMRSVLTTEMRALQVHVHTVYSRLLRNKLSSQQYCPYHVHRSSYRR